jgi:hypothetical protein
MFGEGSRLDPAKDTIEVHLEPIGSYPNLFFDVEGRELSDFIDMLANFDGSDRYRLLFERFNVGRGDPRFWSTYDWIQRRFDAEEPITAGVYDLNRYRPTPGAPVAQKGWLGGTGTR